MAIVTPIPIDTPSPVTADTSVEELLARVAFVHDRCDELDKREVQLKQLQKAAEIDDDQWAKILEFADPVGSVLQENTRGLDTKVAQLITNSIRSSLQESGAAWDAKRHALAKSAGVGLKQMDAIRKLTLAAHDSAKNPALKTHELWGSYRKSAEGIYVIIDDQPKQVCGQLDVLGLTRDPESNNWGLLIEVTDPDGHCKKHRVPACDLDKKDEVISGLRGLGLTNINPRLLMAFLQDAHANRNLPRVTTTTTCGWVGDVFMTPNGPIGRDVEPREWLYQHEVNVPVRHGTSGEFTTWKTQVAKKCDGNSLLTVSMCSAFVGPVLGLTSFEAAGIHVYGGSSEGKTTTLISAGSVWGGGDPRTGFARPWNMTINGLEQTAKLHSHTFLPIDEMGGGDVATLSKSVYMLANGAGKVRMVGQSHTTWKTCLLSTGEASTGELAEQIGKRANSGTEVRLIPLPSNAGKGLGVFENIHEARSAKKFAEDLTEAALSHYGHAGSAWVQYICDNEKQKLVKTICARVNKIDLEFASRLEQRGVGASGKANMSPVIGRVRGHMALIAAVGVEVAHAGIIPIDEKYIVSAAYRQLVTWIKNRGSVQSLDARDAVKAVRSFVMQEYDSSLIHLRQKPGGGHDSDNELRGLRKGWAWESDIDGQLIALADGVLEDICKRHKLSLNTVLDALNQADLLVSEGGRKKAKTPVLPDGTRLRCYTLRYKKLVGDISGKPEDQ